MRDLARGEAFARSLKARLPCRVSRGADSAAPPYANIVRDKPPVRPSPRKHSRPPPSWSTGFLYRLPCSSTRVVRTMCRRFCASPRSSKNGARQRRRKLSASTLRKGWNSTASSGVSGRTPAASRPSLEDFLLACGTISIPELEDLVAANAKRGEKGKAKKQLEKDFRAADLLREESTYHFLQEKKK